MDVASGMTRRQIRTEHTVRDRLYDLACAILQDEVKAEDTVQHTFLRLFGGHSVA